MTDSSRLYSVDRPEALELRPLDGLTLAFHRPSGATHLLDSPLPEILAVLSTGPCSAEAVLEQLARDYILEEEQGSLLDGVADYLNTLASLGIVRITQ